MTQSPSQHTETKQGSFIDKQIVDILRLLLLKWEQLQRLSVLCHCQLNIFGFWINNHTSFEDINLTS